MNYDREEFGRHQRATEDMIAMRRPSIRALCSPDQSAALIDAATRALEFLEALENQLETKLEAASGLRNALTRPTHTR